jgi:hypothetical protein
MSTERKHHPFSPSKLQALEPSPHYLGTSEATEASLAGTYQHDATEDEHLDIDNPVLTDDQLEAVMKCREYRDNIIAKYPGCTVIKEEYMCIDDARIKDESGKEWEGTTAGYVDLAVVSADATEAEICDWKFGFWSVTPAEDNLQGISYLLSLVKRFPTLKKVTVHFVMPHRDEIDFHTFTAEQFPALYLRVKTVVARAQLTYAEPEKHPCTATVSSCLFCARKGACKVLAAFVLKVSHKYAPVEVPENVTPSIIGDASQSTLLMEISTLMEAWSKAVRRQLTEHSIENPDWVPEGYAFRSRANTVIKDFDKVEAAARVAGVTDAQLKAARKFGMTEIHKAISDAQPRGEKKAAVEAFTNGLIAEGAAEKEAPIYFLQRLKT